MSESKKKNIDKRSLSVKYILTYKTQALAPVRMVRLTIGRQWQKYHHGRTASKNI